MLVVVGGPHSDWMLLGTVRKGILIEKGGGTK
jgi:hypothetical protein